MIENFQDNGRVMDNFINNVDLCDEILLEDTFHLVPKLLRVTKIPRKTILYGIWI